ncbi:hypothetical protein BBJ28_00011457, partial [Nothophytophthora sp. Chile5]
KDYIEVRPEGVGKGKIVGHLLDKMRADGKPADFVLCIGDDVADELMFDQLDSMVTAGELPKDKVYTCTVGQKPSKAEFFVDDYTDVIALLKTLKVVATKVPSKKSEFLVGSEGTQPVYCFSGAPVIEDQVVPTIDHSGGRHPPPIRRKRNKWADRLQQLGVMAILVAILRWRSGVKNPYEKKLLMYLVASLGIAWSIQRIRAKPRK